MENFSVAAGSPIKKTPKEPASTLWAAGSLSLSLPDSATVVEISQRHEIPTIRAVLNFTFALLRNAALPGSPDFELQRRDAAAIEVPGGRSLPQPPLPHLCWRFRCAT